MLCFTIKCSLMFPSKVNRTLFLKASKETIISVTLDITHNNMSQCSQQRLFVCILCCSWLGTLHLSFPVSTYQQEAYLIEHPGPNGLNHCSHFYKYTSTHGHKHPHTLECMCLLTGNGWGTITHWGSDKHSVHTCYRHNQYFVHSY